MEEQKDCVVSDEQSEEITKTNKVKAFFSDHKKDIKQGAIFLGGVVTGAILIGLAGSGESDQDGDQLVGFDISDSTVTGNTFNIHLERRGHPGNAVKCLETGETYASQNRAADANDISRSSMSRHLKGDSDSAGGLHFERLGEMS